MGHKYGDDQEADLRTTVYCHGYSVLDMLHVLQNAHQSLDAPMIVWHFNTTLAEGMQSFRKYLKKKKLSKSSSILKIKTILNKNYQYYQDILHVKQDETSMMSV